MRLYRVTPQGLVGSHVACDSDEPAEPIPDYESVVNNYRDRQARYRQTINPEKKAEYNRRHRAKKKGQQP